MRVACLLSNHFRSYTNTFDSFQKFILSKYKPYIFIHTWKNQGYDGVRGDIALQQQNLDIRMIEHLYNPSDIIIESNRNFDCSKYVCHSGVRNPEIIFGMFYSIWRANELKKTFEKKHDFIFDAVIRCRADLLFENELTIQQGLHIPNFGDYGGVNDSFAYGSSFDMDLYANCFNNIDMLYDAGVPYQGESMLKANLDYYKLSPQRSDIQYCLLRPNGQKFRLAK